MEKTIDDWSLGYPGIEKVDNLYFHSIQSEISVTFVSITLPSRQLQKKGLTNVLAERHVGCYAVVRLCGYVFKLYKLHDPAERYFVVSLLSLHDMQDNVLHPARWKAKTVTALPREFGKLLTFIVYVSGFSVIFWNIFVRK